MIVQIKKSIAFSFRENQGITFCKYISIRFKTESRGYTVKKHPTNVKKTDKSGHSWSESPSRKVAKPKKPHIKYLKKCSIAFSFRKKRGVQIVLHPSNATVIRVIRNALQLRTDRSKRKLRKQPTECSADTL